MQYLKPQPIAKSKHFIEIKAVTWKKDSHGLFDYESNQVNLKKLQVDTASNIYRKGEEIFIEDSRNPTMMDQEPCVNAPEEEELLILTRISMNSTGSDSALANNIVSNQERYQINPILPELNNVAATETFLIIRSLKNKEGIQKGYELKPGDLIKLGRVEFRIIECKYNNNKVKSIPQITQNFPYSRSNSSSLQKKVCRICLSDEECISDGTIAINPCNCKGSCEYVHFICLKHWLASKITTKVNGNAVYYKTKFLECEVCKSPLPKSIRIGEQNMDILDIARPETPYIILEAITKEKNQSQGLYVVSVVPDQTIKMGRGHICDIRISDISVSRLHAMIKFENEKFIMIDNNSKFGTLVLLNNPYPIDTEKMAIQVGRTVITFAMKQHQSNQQEQNKTNFNNNKSSSKTNNDNNDENIVKQNYLANTNESMGKFGGSKVMIKEMLELDEKFNKLKQFGLQKFPN